MTSLLRKARHGAYTTTHRESRTGVRCLGSDRLGGSKALLESHSGRAGRPPTRDAGSHSGSGGGVDDGVAYAFRGPAAGGGTGTAPGSLGGDAEQIRTPALVSGPPHHLAKFREAWYPSRCKSDPSDADLLLEILTA